METVKVRHMSVDSLIFVVMTSLLAIAAGIWLLTAEFNPNGVRYAYREAMRYPIGIGVIAIALFGLGRVVFWLLTGKLFQPVIELTDTHVHHYPFQTAIPYVSITSIEVPKKGEDSDVRLIRIRWRPGSSTTLQDYYLDFRHNLRFNKTFLHVLRELEARTKVKAVEIPWPQDVARLPAFYRARLF